MFSNLRVGTPIYVLYKNEPRLEEGEVQFVGIPTPQFGTTYVGNTLQPPHMLVDIKVKIGEEVLDLQKLPADTTIADFGSNGMVVSESKESITREIELLRKHSQTVIDSVEHHKDILEKTQMFIQRLNPTAKLEAEQKQKIDYLEQQMSDIKGMLSQLLSTKNE